MNLLAIETSTPYCSVAVGRGEVLLWRHFEAGQRHAEVTLDVVDALLREAGLGLSELQGIAYGEGPGSFTGLRIACGLVQGLALAKSLPVLGIGTLLAIAEASGERKVIACLDARMGEVYHAAYDREGDDWKEASPPGVYSPGSVPLVGDSGWIGCGSGFAAFGPALAARHGPALASTRAEVYPTSLAMLSLARPRFARGEGRDAASAAPIYLRDRVALKTSERAGRRN